MHSGELQLPLTVPNMESRDRVKVWGFPLGELWSESLVAWLRAHTSAQLGIGQNGQFIWAQGRTICEPKLTRPVKESQIDQELKCKEWSSTERNLPVVFGDVEKDSKLKSIHRAPHLCFLLFLNVARGHFGSCCWHQIS